jgi:hypothetical protein
VPKSTDFTNDFEQRETHPQSFATCCAHKSDGKSSAKEHGFAMSSTKRITQHWRPVQSAAFFFSPRLINIVFFFGHFHMFP